MKISLKQLEVFIVVAQHKNMSVAAEKIYLTQSACSMALAKLEKSLGGLLFDRNGKHTILNDRGRYFLPKAVAIVEQAQELEKLMLSPFAHGIGKLIIGASSTIGNYLLPVVIGKFVQTYSGVDIKLRISNTENIVMQVANFEVDMGFIEGSCHLPELYQRVCGQDQLVIVANPEHPLAKKKTITKEALYQAQWILREPGSGTRDCLEKSIDTPIVPFMELGQTEAIKRLVQAGLGISCMSRLAVTASELTILEIPFLNLRRNFYLLLHKNKYETQIMKAFLECFEKYQTDVQ